MLSAGLWQRLDRSGDDPSFRHEFHESTRTKPRVVVRLVTIREISVSPSARVIGRFFRSADRRGTGPRRGASFGAVAQHECWVGSTQPSFQLLQGKLLVARPRWGGEFFEARIIPKRIEHWIEPEQCWSERRSGECAGPVSRVVSVKRRWRGRPPRFALPPGQGSRAQTDH